MNPDLEKLQPYPFERLMALKQGLTPPAQLSHIAMSIGEPKHAAPAFAKQALADSLDSLNHYPLTKGGDELRTAIASWLIKRFQLSNASVDPERHVIPVSGTREALFAFAQALVDRSKIAKVLMPNPFYQIYEGATLLAGAQPVFLNTTKETNYLIDIDAINEQTWHDCQLIYICSPGNPTGAVMSLQQMQHLIELAEKFDFVIASDECYSEIYPHEQTPPAGLLEAAHAMGNTDFKHCLVFNSLSKRSNLPGLRSGFVAGDADIIAKFLKYRTYHGCAIPPPAQVASTAAWSDETHVLQNRELYRAKFAAVLDILMPVLDVQAPDASFYLWPRLPVDDTVFAKRLFAEQHLSVIPGQFLSRQADGINPGQNHIRMALVASIDECIEAAERMKQVLSTL
ncbi:MAG: succinyldiaminopimelate transaminase [Gammaproteobacteria bacterium]|nr:succinyldiaminopimelate transaminase [Gammaproteobacteria bacterium]